LNLTGVRLDNGHYCCSENIHYALIETPTTELDVPQQLVVNCSTEGPEKPPSTTRAAAFCRLIAGLLKPTASKRKEPSTEALSADPPARRRTKPPPVFTSTVPPARSGEQTRPKPPSEPPLGHVQLTHTALYMQLQLSPAGELDSIADRLASHYAWTAEERRRHLSRLYDIRRTTALDLLHEKTLAPLARAPSNVDACSIAAWKPAASICTC